SVADIEAAENPEEVAQHIAKIMEQGYDRFETRHRCKDGTLLDIEVNVSYLAGEAAEFIAFLRDITERRKSEIQLKQQRKELREFAYAMAHDLKSHLLSIEGYAEVLKTEHDMTCAKKIGQLATHMNVLLRRSLLLADAGQIIEKTEEVALTGLVQEIAEVAVPERVRFELENLPTVRGDPEKLSQVFQNLLENAVEHGQPRTIEVRRRETADGTELLVMNDGKAIPPDQRAALFDREFTTKEGGRGLGVAIIRKVIEAHGWQIHLDETPETTFRIFIPTSRKL
ncbi:MAG: sensor histidine kinase, partial [Candidatus Heimdallarchaeota archaeon]